MTGDHNPQKKLVFGCSGSGKSTMFRKLIMGSGWRYVYVFDWDLKLARNTGWKAAQSMEGLCRLQDAGRPVLFFPDPEQYATLKEAFAFFCNFVWHQIRRLRGKKVFGVDELQTLVSTNYQSFPPSFSRLLDYGRNHELDMVLAAQRIDGMSKIIRGQMTEVFCFKHSEFDVDAWQEMREIGIDPEAVKALPHATNDGRVGWIYKHGLTGRTETVTHEIKRNA
jgi:hypothetical protein